MCGAVWGRVVEVCVARDTKPGPPRIVEDWRWTVDRTTPCGEEKRRRRPLGSLGGAGQVAENHRRRKSLPGGGATASSTYSQAQCRFGEGGAPKEIGLAGPSCPFRAEEGVHMDLKDHHGGRASIGTGRFSFWGRGWHYFASSRSLRS